MVGSISSHSQVGRRRYFYVLGFFGRRGKEWRFQSVATGTGTQGL